MKSSNNDTYATESAYKRVEQLKSIYVHIIAYVTVNVSIFSASFNGFGLPDTFWDTSLFITLVFGAIGVLGHWAGTIGYRIFFSEKKERTLTEKFIREEEEKRAGV